MLASNLWWQNGTHSYNVQRVHTPRSLSRIFTTYPSAITATATEPAITPSIHSAHTSCDTAGCNETSETKGNVLCPRLYRRRPQEQGALAWVPHNKGWLSKAPHMNRIVTTYEQNSYHNLHKQHKHLPTQIIFTHVQYKNKAWSHEGHCPTWQWVGCRSSTYEQNSCTISSHHKFSKQTTQTLTLSRFFIKHIRIHVRWNSSQNYCCGRDVASMLTLPICIALALVLASFFSVHI